MNYEYLNAKLYMEKLIIFKDFAKINPEKLERDFANLPEVASEVSTIYARCVKDFGVSKAYYDSIEATTYINIRKDLLEKNEGKATDALVKAYVATNESVLEASIKVCEMEARLVGIKNQYDIIMNAKRKYLEAVKEQMKLDIKYGNS